MTPLPREIYVVCVTKLSRDKFTMGNIHSYVKKKKETAHNIKRGKLLGVFDTQGQSSLRKQLFPLALRR